MEDIFSILLIIVSSAIVGILKKGAQSSDKKSQSQRTKTGRGFEEMKNLARKALEIEDSIQIVLPDVEKAKVKPKAKPVKAVSVLPSGMKKAVQGQSFQDDHGCIGGSLSHEGHEGDDRRIAIPNGPSFELEPSAFEEASLADELHTMNLQDMRRAVVLSEVLGKPKALRRR